MYCYTFTGNDETNRTHQKYFGKDYRGIDACPDEDLISRLEELNRAGLVPTLIVHIVGRVNGARWIMEHSGYTTLEAAMPNFD